MWRRLDDVLRFVYVLFAPALMVGLAKLVPVLGIVISTGIATAIALTGSSQWIRTVSTIPVAGKGLAKFGRLGEYYRAHPPKPLLYYALYPLLFPYWLWNNTARREFLVYKRIGALALIVTIATSTYDYFHNWQPLPFGYFAKAMFVTAVLQLLITFMFVMPIVTTLLTYQRSKHRRTTWALTALALLLGLVTWSATRHEDKVTFVTQARLRARIKWQPEVARAAIHAAFDSKDALETVFRPDEARAFHFVPIPDGVLLWARTRNHEVAWCAKTRSGFVISAAQLPETVRTELELDATALAWP